MRISGTHEAFKKLLSERGIYKRLGVDRSTVSNWKKGIQKVSLDKMEEILLKSGATIVKEKIWNVPKKAQGEKKEEIKPPISNPLNMVTIYHMGQ